MRIASSTQIVGFNNPQVGGDSVTCPDHHNVTRHQRGESPPFHGSPDESPPLRWKAYCECSAAIFPHYFLDMANQGIDHRDAGITEIIDPVPHDRSQQRGCQQDVNQDIVEMGEEAEPAGLPGF